jgi:hypothetical protein
VAKLVEAAEVIACVWLAVTGCMFDVIGRINGEGRHRDVLLARFGRVITSITPKPENRKDFLQAQPLCPRIILLTYAPVQSYVSMAGLATPSAQDNMVDLFARRLKLATRAIGMTDVLSPSQVRTFSDCEVRWFYQHLLGLPDPATATMALDNAIRTALMTNFRYKGESKTDIQTEGVVGLFRRAWKQQRTAANFCEDEVPEAICGTGDRDSSASTCTRWRRKSGQPQSSALSVGYSVAFAFARRSI